MEKGLIYEKAIAVMADMEALGKDRRNTQQGYNFRGIDDVYNMVQPIMAKHGIIMRSEILEDRSEERQSKGGGVLIYRIFKIRYYLVASDGSEISTMVIGEGMDSGDKAANKAMSVAQKYAILQMFMIPTVDQKDPEDDNPEPKPKGSPKSSDKTKSNNTPATGAEPKDKTADKTAPMTDDQMKSIMAHTEAFQKLTGKTDEEMGAALKRRIKAVYGVEIAGIREINSAMANTLIDTLKKWAAADLKKKMAGTPPNDGAPGGPEDPGEGASE